MARIFGVLIMALITVLSFVAAVITQLSSWFGWFGSYYEPYVDGPDSITLMLAALVSWLYLDRQIKGVK